MSEQRIAIIGLGRVGTAFLSALLAADEGGTKLVAVSEIKDTPGRQMAQAQGILLLSIEEIVALGEYVDVLFDLTGDAVVRRTVRDQLQKSGNTHTVLASEAILRVIWSMIGAPPLPATTGRYEGY